MPRTASRFPRNFATSSWGSWFFPSPDRKPCVWVLPAVDYDAIVEASLTGYSLLADERLELERALSGPSEDAELDSAGRIVLPASMLRHAVLDRDVVVVGAVRRLELWEPAAWAARAEPLADSLRQMTARLGHAG